MFQELTQFPLTFMSALLPEAKGWKEKESGELGMVLECISCFSKREPPGGKNAI